MAADQPLLQPTAKTALLTPTTNPMSQRGKKIPTTSLGSESITNVVSLDTNPMSVQRGDKST